MHGHHHGNLIVSGDAYVPGGKTLRVSGNLRLQPGACLEAFTIGTVHVRGNIRVGEGAVLALGCTPNSIGPFPPCNDVTTNDTVGGNIVAEDALTMYLDGNTVHGDVISRGGGPGLQGDFINFPIKDNASGATSSSAAGRAAGQAPSATRSAETWSGPRTGACRTRTRTRS